MSCPEIEKIAQDEPDEAAQAHLASCEACRERRAKLARLLEFPAVAEPPPDVLPRLLARIQAPVTKLAPPAPRRRAFVALLAAAVMTGALLALFSDDGQTLKKERHLQTLVVESEWRGLGFPSEKAFLDAQRGG